MSRSRNTFCIASTQLFKDKPREELSSSHYGILFYSSLTYLFEALSVLTRSRGKARKTFLYIHSPFSNNNHDIRSSNLFSRETVHVEDSKGLYANPYAFKNLCRKAYSQQVCFLNSLNFVLSDRYET